MVAQKGIIKIFLINSLSAPKIALRGSCTDMDICNDTYAKCINFKCSCQEGSSDLGGYCCEDHLSFSNLN